ncbi:hypothetical protein VFA_001050 [Vibrio furnissii CIP 102972]|nr:hypothetical protein VFA_001050 [Vibrio furnissii CIP 102972]
MCLNDASEQSITAHHVPEKKQPSSLLFRQESPPRYTFI